jgi:protease-4
MRFLGNVLATIIGIFVFFMLFFFGIVLIGAIFGGEPEGVEVKSNSVIELNLENVTNDYAGKYKEPWMDIFSDKKCIGLSDIIKAITAAKTDNDIKGISILNDESSLGLAQSKELREALNDFKKSGKFVMAYANNYSQKEYYLNSVANTIYLNPVGDLDFKGLSTEVMFFKDFQEKSGIKMEVIRHGKYKSAVEPFLENKMSDANREQTTALLHSVWSSVLADISASRNISPARLNEIATGLLARTPEMAKANKLIDIVAYEDVYHNAIKKALKVKADEDYNKISIADYTQKIATTSLLDIDTDNQIAIIYAQGEIQSGEGDVNVIGEGSMRRSLQEARKNKDIKAIVLRIDSPGGSALTSDLIWREIELTKKTKPVVVSMGNYAASGGYYIACNANTIFAEKNTITGSIGVFGILPNFSQLTTKIGVHTEQVMTNDNANYSPFVPLNEKFKAVTLEGVERVYKTFVTHVAEGRKMTFAQVDSIAQGRVWTGTEALKIGLVDKIGNLDDAIKEAASLAKIKNYSTQNFPEYEKNFSDFLAKLPFAQSKEALIIEEIGEENYRIMQQIKKLKTEKGIQALMPFEINIQ